MRFIPFNKGTDSIRELIIQRNVYAVAIWTQKRQR